jgi:hypothetical protein
MCHRRPERLRSAFSSSSSSSSSSSFSFWETDQYSLKVPRAQCSAHVLLFEIVHQLHKTRLGLLSKHGFALNGLDLGHSLAARLICGEGANVVKNVD